MKIEIEGVYQATYLNMMSSIIKELKLPQLMDSKVPVDHQCQTKPSDIVQLILLDILSGRQAIVHLEEWAKQIDIEKLIREGIQHSDLNDDAIGRHLDRLHGAGIHEIASTFFLQTYQHEKIPIRVLHGDTTSKSLYGAYEKPSKVLKITEGFSRDILGAKQIQFGLIGNEDGIPIYGDVYDGNKSDKEWNPTVLEKLHQQFENAKLDQTFIYVADSAAMSQNTLEKVKAAHAYLITRGPNQLKIVKQALEQADQEDTVWSEPVQYVEKTGATYRFFETESNYYGYDVRLVVVESSALDKKKEKTLQKRQEEESRSLEQKQKDFDKSPFHCKEDAIEAAKQFEKSHGSTFHTLTTTIESIERIKPKKGRPKKGVEPEKETIYTVKINFSFEQQLFDQVRRRASRFVLVTTLPKIWEGQTMDGQAILSMYKGQIHVEMNFSFLKDPVYTDEVYLKKPERVLVLGYLFLLALVIYRVFQRRLRQVITEQRPIKGAGGRMIKRPTGQAIFQLFKYVQVVVLKLPDGSLQRQFAKPLTYEQQRVIKDLGMDESIYL